jgi:hypothetical protein
MHTFISDRSVFIIRLSPITQNPTHGWGLSCCGDARNPLRHFIASHVEYEEMRACLCAVESALSCVQDVEGSEPVDHLDGFLCRLTYSAAAIRFPYMDDITTSHF